MFGNYKNNFISPSLVLYLYHVEDNEAYLLIHHIRLRSTFLYVRVTRNPTNYRLEPTSGMTTDNILQGIFGYKKQQRYFLLTTFYRTLEICVKDLELLEENNLIEKSQESLFKSTRNSF